jgi:[ribosomal protein S5]-alanine N-acetyltransferase
MDDTESLLRIYSNPEFTRFWSTEPWTSSTQATALIEEDLHALAAGERLRLGIFLREQNTLIGTCSLFHLSEQCRRAEVGYGIAPEHWRQGYMFEAVSALLGFAFDELRMNRIEADIDPRNTASACSLEKLGFKREGLLHERWIVGEQVSDSAIYGLLAREWKTSHSALQYRASE